MSVFAKLFSATPAIKKCEVQKIISDKPGAKSFDLILMSSKESSHVENKNTFSLWSFIHWIYCLTLFTIHKSRHLEIKMRCAIKKSCCKHNVDQHRIQTWRRMCFRRVMISVKTSKSNQNVGLRHANFVIMNLSGNQNWRGGNFYGKNLEHRDGLWLNGSIGVVLVGS